MSGSPAFTLSAAMSAAADTLSIEQNISLAPYTTFGIGGAARFFVTATTEAGVADACRFAEENTLPLFVLGGGSNILVSDAGWPGLVVHVALRGLEQQGCEFHAAAGEDWDALVARTVEADCAGMECLAGIPGSVGGTPVQNVGAYGQEVAQTITKVRCYDRLARAFVVFTNPECRFRYRASRFNTGPEAGRSVVTSVRFTLTPGGSPNLSYPDLQRAFAGRSEAPSLAEVAEQVRRIRRAKGMVVDAQASLDARDPDTRSAGSYFKNPVVLQAFYERIAREHSGAPGYPAPSAPNGEPQRKIPAAWLVEQAGFGKGFALGAAGVSGKHSLALTNRSGSAKAAEVLALQRRLQDGVEARFGIRLQPEPIFVG